ncbi:MAG: phosphoglycolate phosphatase [Ruminococcaceae bacterium]|nr:phosphoglycolate phosphatase [Oscillospiraceae bacterium]
MNRYKLAIFDLDGTLMDTTEGFVSAVKYTIEKMGYPMLSDKELSAFIGPPIQDSFAKAYGLEGPILQEIATVFRDRYSVPEVLFLAKPYDGIYDVFEGLLKRGVMPAVATYKREDYAVSLLKYYGFDRYTDILFGGDHENKLKKKDIIEKCINVAGITDKAEVVMIGDTKLDAIGAEGIGVDFLGVTYGFGFKTPSDAQEYGAVGCVDNAIDLLKYFD